MIERALPYCGAAPLPADWLGRWNLDPLLILFLLGAAWSLRHARGPRLAVLIAALLFVSPLCALSSALFSARVAHHLVLTALAAPLLTSLAPRRIGGPWLWSAIHALVFWIWHAPDAYAAALASHALFWLMQLSLLVSAAALWASVLRAPPPVGVAALLATMLQMGLLGALLTFSATPLYAPHLVTTAPWGLTALADQQLAGLLMWVAGSAAYLAAAMHIAWRWLGGAPAAPSASASA